MGRDVITEIIERLTRIEAKLEDGLLEKVDENTRRIRNLERFWWIALGVLSTLQFLAPILINLIWR